MTRLRTALGSRLLAWYTKSCRDLPWRSRPNPYRTWISEIMLQQTRVEAVLPYYRRWLERFPTIRAVAAASEEDVLRLWEGLGYYSRARNLHRAARIIVDDMGGSLPAEPNALRKIPGIGEYTAAAISSIAFNRDIVALDGNVRRVLARVFNVRALLGTALAERRLRELAEEHLPRGKAGDFNQALMDLGAQICVPRHPGCERCPLGSMCAAKRLGLQAHLPKRRPSAPLPHHIMAAAILIRRRSVLLTRRPSDGLLGGLWRFPQVKLPATARSVPAAARKLPRALSKLDGIAVVQPEHVSTLEHTYSHFSVTVHAFGCRLGMRSAPTGFIWIPLLDLPAVPMGRVDRLIARQLSYGKPVGTSRLQPGDGRGFPAHG